MGIKVSMDELPKETMNESIEEGLYIIQVEDVIEDESPQGDPKITMSHSIPGTNVKINYDNYLLEKNGKPNNFGRVKLRKIVEASKIDIEEITPTVLKRLLVGKRVKAEIDKNNKGYPQIHFADIYPLDYEEEAVNEDAAKQNTDTEETKEDLPEASEEVSEELNVSEDDI